jgi:XrtN system VIT domain protein
VILAVNNSYGIRESWRSRTIDKTVILLNLFLISAYALNRTLAVFAESVDWLSAYLIITSVVLLSYRYYSLLPSWINCFQLFALGSSLLFYFYLSLYVANIYVFGAVGIFLLGVGAHIFVPLTLFIVSVILVSGSIKNSWSACFWIAAGTVTAVLALLSFTLHWNSRIERIETLANQSVIHEDNGLPIWVNVAKSIDKDWISERILKSELVYATHSQQVPWNSLRFNSWEETDKHDPFVFISSIFAKCSLSIDDRIKILQAVFSDRHNANERLWSGADLTTSYILSDIDIYPELRIAYIEKYLNVRNNATPGRSGRPQEAIYTFQLPEGAVATSLSLWINGKEEKGLLTSKQKAINAYKTIVGVESRDPSVIHWQEGNTVTVRVFPCTPNEERKFKVGFTSPLPERNGQLLVENISFKGPSASGSRETIRLRFIGNKPEINVTGFKPYGNGALIAERTYDPDFQFSFKAAPIVSNHFTFDGHIYSLKSYKPTFKEVSFQNVYFDLNSSWTDAEVASVKELISTKNVFVVSEEGFHALTKDNYKEFTSSLLRQNFSVFPFHLLHDESQSIVITKGRKLSPHLSDFKDSMFAMEIGKYFSTGHRVAVYNIDDNVSTYIASLREFRTVNFASGSLGQLKCWLAENKFPENGETASSIIVHDSKVSIEKTTSRPFEKGVVVAPDHLARLFAYNDIMRKVGPNYFDNSFITSELVNQASEAYVVSPVSSLIVLETQEDYERFGIQESVNSLQNAVRQSTGAVPEPHEWALIILFALLLIFLKVRRIRLHHSL